MNGARRPDVDDSIEDSKLLKHGILRDGEDCCDIGYGEKLGAHLLGFRDCGRSRHAGEIPLASPEP